MLIFSSFRLFISGTILKSIFQPSNSPFFTPLKIQSLSSKSSICLIYRSITTERLSVKPIYSSPKSTVSLQPIEELPPKLQEIVKLFQEVEQPKAKYEQLLFYGKNLTLLDKEFKTNENRVKGCVSQVWVRAYLDDDKNVVFEADSDSMLTKGLAALLVQGLSGRPVAEIVRVTPDFVTLLGLQQGLTPSRNNGFLNMLKLMQRKALQLYVEAEKGDKLGDGMIGNGRECLDLEVKNVDGDVIGGVSYGESAGGSRESSSDSGNDGLLGSRGMRIKERLEMELKPVDLVVEDISYQHAGHAGVRGSDGETHFNVKVVSDEFEGKSLVKRHRLIYESLQDELESGLHALSIVAKTPSEASVDVAKASVYVHYGEKSVIYPRVLKAFNFPLGCRYESSRPHLVGYGLVWLGADMRVIHENSRFWLVKQSRERFSNLPTKVSGTHGYLTPEFALYGQLTEEFIVLACRSLRL
ncbi:hypothetical protein LIER_43500 [Lithospermum erythrorhizon]|uniref:Fe-S metabolism associated domain-containing protein n=1 Tax=Lithospermum erythrorhizon TaxID=34254 RepID=A0AAV3Q9W0_LITER